MEGMRLRIKAVDFDHHVIIVRDAKGGKNRVVMLPQTLAPACAGAEIPQGWPDLGLVLDVSVAHTVHRSALK